MADVTDVPRKSLGGLLSLWDHILTYTMYCKYFVFVVGCFFLRLHRCCYFSRGVACVAFAALNVRLSKQLFAYFRAL